MSRSIRSGVGIALALLVAIAPLACSRKQAGRGAPSENPSEHAVENPADVPRPCPPQPTGPQTAGRDSLLNRFRSELEPWVAMWAAAQPGFGLDSTWRVSRERWALVDVRPYEPLPPESEDDVTLDILGIRSPDGRYTLDVDSYQSIQPHGDDLEVGGEPDSQSSLIDERAKREAILGQFGTTGGYHWGAWLTASSFALGSWREADDYGQWLQARLAIYSIPDSSVSEYETRIVSEADYQRYAAAWHQWLLERYRSLKPRRRV